MERIEKGGFVCMSSRSYKQKRGGKYCRLEAMKHDFSFVVLAGSPWLPRFTWFLRR
jgi:hypothetical protein